MDKPLDTSHMSEPQLIAAALLRVRRLKLVSAPGDILMHILLRDLAASYVTIPADVKGALQAFVREPYNG